MSAVRQWRLIWAVPAPPTGSRLGGPCQWLELQRPDLGRAGSAAERNQSSLPWRLFCLLSASKKKQKLLVLFLTVFPGPRTLSGTTHLFNE